MNFKIIILHMTQNLTDLYKSKIVTCMFYKVFIKEKMSFSNLEILLSSEQYIMKTEVKTFIVILIVILSFLCKSLADFRVFSLNS